MGFAQPPSHFQKQSKLVDAARQHEEHGVASARRAVCSKRQATNIFAQCGQQFNWRGISFIFLDRKPVAPIFILTCLPSASPCVSRVHHQKQARYRMRETTGQGVLGAPNTFDVRVRLCAAAPCIGLRDGFLNSNSSPSFCFARTQAAIDSSVDQCSRQVARFGRCQCCCGCLDCRSGRRYCLASFRFRWLGSISRAWWQSVAATRGLGRQ